MATTWTKTIHRGMSIAGTLKLRADYIKDVGKTDGGIFVDSYECDARTVDSEFLFSKRLYEQKTGRDQSSRDVIAYHVRMSFRPGEVTPGQVLELGRELAMRWTKGRHQFIVAAHTNTNSPHAHIIFNSVNLDCTGKYSDFKRSAIALRRVSDLICLEHGLSVIEKPGLSKGHNRAEYLGAHKPPGVRGQLRDVIDSVLPASKDFDEFLNALVEKGIEIKRGKQLAFRLPGGKKFSRQDTLGDDYTVDAILERISGKRAVAPKASPAAPAPIVTAHRPSLLIDIQAKIQEGKGGGYERWARLFNLQQAAKTLIFLQENKLDDYEKLVAAAAEASAQFNGLSEKVKATDGRLKEISELQRQIGVYSKTREAHQKYLASGRDPGFYEAHRADLTLHQAARKYFDSKGYGRKNPLPKMDALKREYATLAAGKGRQYAEYKAARQRMVELQTAKQNADTILGIREPQERIHERGAPSL